MLENIIDVTMGLLLGLFLGMLVSLLYWRRRVRVREGHIINLKTSMKTKDSEMQDMRVRANELLSQLKKEKEVLNTKLKEYEIVVENRENTIDTLNIQLKDYETLLNEREKRADLLNTQLGERDKNIKDMNQQITEKDESINLLNKKANELDEKNKELVTRVNKAEEKVIELEKSLEKHEQEIKSMKTRMHVMQDDFTHILGIGPKVSSILRSAGINTFDKLASTDIARIKEILIDENPRLLRLTDPSTWSKQARLASKGDWEALSALKENLKGSRSLHSSKVDEENIQPVIVELEVI